MSEPPLSFVGASTLMRALDLEVTAAAKSDAKVLITGESGVGKEVTARLIHQRSARVDKPLVALNCAGVPDTLLESELFGHVRGSFTGAYRDKPGILESAHRGTVFLDEVGEMSLRMQALLLRFLETGEIQRVGAERASTHLDVRVICATNRHLADRIASGTFREDLYYRLNVVHLHVPNLRDRRDDLPLLIDHFVKHFAARHRVPSPVLAPETTERLTAYEWPGNVRELKNIIERLVVRACHGVVTPSDLPNEVRSTLRGPALPADAPSSDMLADVVARDLYRRMTQRQESFWTVVYDPFMARDLTRDTLRRVVAYGLDEVSGRYSALTDLFRIPKDDYKRFLNFLRKHECLVPFHPSRAGKVDAAGAEPRRTPTEERVA